MAVNFRAETGKWQVDYLVRNEKGQRRRKYESFDTQEEAEDFLAEVRRKKRTKDLIHAEALFGSFALRYVELWKEGRVRGKKRPKPSTQRAYDQIVSDHLIPAFGAGRVQAVRRSDVEDFEYALFESGRSEKTRRNILNVLSAVMDHAVRERLREENPAIRLHLTREADSGLGWKELAALGAEEVEANEKEFIAPLDEAKMDIYIRTVLDRYQASQPIRAFLCEAAGTAKRRGEMHGGRWGDYDLGKSPEVHVRQSMDPYEGEIPPKTRNGYRTIPLPPYAAQALREWRLSCPDRSNGALVYVTLSTGRRMNMRNGYECHQTILKLIGVPPFKLNGLRDCFASLHAERGMKTKTLSYLMGHSEEWVTNRFYKKASRDGIEAARKIMEGR